MNIYLVSQEENTGYDTYDSFVVAAENEQEAREKHPSTYVTHRKDGKWFGTYAGGPSTGEEYETEGKYGSWVQANELEKVKVQLIGKAEEGVKGIICASFNAG